MGDVTPTRLRCEYLSNPLAIDAAKPRLSWVLESDQRAVSQLAYQILAAQSKSDLESDKGDLWDSGKVASGDTTQVVYAGKPLCSGQDVYWKVRVWTQQDEPSAWSKTDFWKMGLLEKADWSANWIGAAGPRPEPKSLEALPATMLRKSFDLDKPVKRAIAYISALGLYEARINGNRVGEQILAPEWTNYHKRVQYQAYDVTDMLQSGSNAVGGILGDGWYAGRIGLSHIVKDGPLRGIYGNRPRFLLQMQVEFADGSTQTIATDGSWKANTDGPIRKSCMLDGEVYDARKELPGWDSAGFDDSGWQQPDVAQSIAAELVPQVNEPIRVTQELKPVKLTEPAPGVYVFDFGQNMPGFCRLKVTGKAGTEIRLRHVEVLTDDGNIYRDNLRINDENGLGARQEDVFILRGDGAEVFEPHFTYHGFRYVEVVGLAEKPAMDSIVARVFHSAPPTDGVFECSSDLLNKLMHNIVWTQRCNMHSIPTDCPQRDERLGWMGDMLVFAQPACFNMDMAAFFTKWVVDIREAQAKDGRYPDFAPHPFDPDARFSGVPGWGDAGVIVPWRMYVNYGDTRVLAEHFESARQWVDYIHSQNPDLLWNDKRHNDYGDWLNGDTLQLEGYPKGGAEMPKEQFGTVQFQRSAALVGKMAAVLGRQADAEKYNKLAADIRQAFIKAHIKDDGRIEGDTQAGYAMALAFNLVPEQLREAATRHMLERVEAYKWHISTGFHSTIEMMNELTRAGHNDVAYRLINNRTMPSWGYTIDHGGTTIWERWDGYVEGRGYQNPGMNSFNHYAIGSVGEWMYRTILGINPDEASPGYKHFTLRPIPGGGLEWAKGSCDSIRGKISSAWRIAGDDLELTVSVPANTTATLYVPASDAGAVSESGKPAAEAEGVKFLRMKNGAAVYEIASGTYRFVSADYR